MREDKDDLEYGVDLTKLTLYVKKDAILPKSMTSWTPENTEYVLIAGNLALQKKLAIKSSRRRAMITVKRQLELLSMWLREIRR
jgi:hypothetical protein